MVRAPSWGDPGSCTMESCNAVWRLSHCTLCALFLWPSNKCFLSEQHKTVFKFLFNMHLEPDVPDMPWVDMLQAACAQESSGTEKSQIVPATAFFPFQHGYNVAMEGSSLGSSCPWTKWLHHYQQWLYYRAANSHIVSVRSLWITIYHFVLWNRNRSTQTYITHDQNKPVIGVTPNMGLTGA